jgi:hypothetical protein
LRLGKPTGLEFRPSYKGPVRLNQCPDCASGYRNSKKVGQRTRCRRSFAAGTWGTGCWRAQTKEQHMNSVTEELIKFGVTGYTHEVPDTTEPELNGTKTSTWSTTVKGYQKYFTGHEAEVR